MSELSYGTIPLAFDGVPRDAMEPATPYLAFQVDSSPSGPVLKVASELVLLSEKWLYENSQYVDVEDYRVTITCVNTTAVYFLGDVIKEIKNDKGEVVDTMVEARLQSLTKTPWPPPLIPQAAT